MAKARTSKVAPKRARAQKTAPALPSASLDAKHLIEIGARYSGQKLITLAHAVMPKVAKHPFARFGFDAAWATSMEGLIGQIEAQAGSKAALEEDAAPTAEALRDATAAGKAWRDDALTTISITPKLRGRGPGASGGSLKGLKDSIRKLLPLVAHAAAADHGGGAETRREGERLLAAIEKAEKAHAKAIAAMSPEARALNQAEGILCEELRRLARAARRVAPAEAALFAVDAHVRTHKPSRRRKNSDAPETPKAASGSGR